MADTKTLPSIHSDKGYVKDSEDYAKRQIQNLKVGDIEKALSRAYLDGAQSAIRIGYLLAEKDYKETIEYYKRQIKQHGDNRN